jgi:hypothetical protein
MNQHRSTEEKAGLRGALSRFAVHTYVWKSVLVLLLGAGLAAFVFPSAGTFQANVELPIRVMLPDQATTSVTLNASNGSATDSLYIQAHQIGYSSFEEFSVHKASIRVNGDQGGSWVDVTNALATCKHPEETLNCITGPYPVVRFEIAARDLGPFQDGANTIEFRLNYASSSESPDAFGSRSTAYRVLDIELRDAGDNDLIDGTTFSWDDPSAWDAPRGASASNGESLWHERDRLVWGADGRSITASCADCHHRNGRDLQYFAFSNGAVINRAKFHGLTTQQAKDVAAYIRSRELRDVDDGHRYDPPARPWTPVYQPGPSSRASRSEQAPRDRGTPIHQMPSNGSQYWTAGAGLDWALDHDRETLPYLFPQGVSQADIDADSSLRMWHVPTALQFADWNGWLPAHHPLDQWGSAFQASTIRNVYHGAAGTNRAIRADFIDCWASRGDDTSCLQKADRYMKYMWFYADQFSKDWGSADVASGFGNTTHQAEDAFKNLNLMKWASVKQWEVMHTYDLADETRVLHPGADRLHWLGGDQRNPFDNAPHILGAYAGDKTGVWDRWLETMWYEVQTRIAAGQGIHHSIRPVDWKYQFMKIAGYRKASTDLSHALRFVTSVAKVQQVCESNAQTFQDGQPQAWWTRVRHCDFGSTMGWEANWLVPTLNRYESGLAREVYEALFRENVEKMMYRYSPSLGSDVDANWTRQSGEYGWESGNYTVETDGINASTWSRSTETPTHYWHVMRDMSVMGVSATLLDSAAAWNDAMVPDPAWDRFRCTTYGGSLDCSVSQSVQLQEGWNFISLHVAPSDSSVAGILTGLRGLSMAKDGVGNAYIPSLGVNTIGTWSTGKGYKVHTDASQTLEVSGGPIAADQPIRLQQGWNLVPFLPRAPMDAAVAFQSIGDVLKRARDEQGNTYDPSKASDANGIGQLVPGRSYAVYVTEATTLRYP